MTAATRSGRVRFLAAATASWALAFGAGGAEPTGPSPKEWVVRSETPTPILRPREGEREPWVGVSVHKPPEALYEQLAGVPKAVGFVVHEVTAKGPAAAAGLRQYDFLWKLNDQLLVNEAQFLVLLHLHEAGEAVTLTYQRDGENRDCQVVLGERPTSERGERQADIVVMRGPAVPGLPDQVVDILRRYVEIRDEQGVTVRLERKGEDIHWQRVAADGRLLEEGELAGQDEIAFPPKLRDDLTKKLRVMIRTLEDAEERARSGVRSSRVRRVPVGERP